MVSLLDEIETDKRRIRELLISLDDISSVDKAHQLFVEVHNWREPPESVSKKPLFGGAIVSHVAQDFAGNETATSGHLPFPIAGQYSATLQEILNSPADQKIIVYPAPGAGLASATRAWLVLSVLGRQKVQVLEPTRHNSNNDQHSSPAQLSVSLPPITVVTAEDAHSIAAAGTLLDARPREIFEGNGSTPSHIPGAVSAPASELLDDQGHLRSAPEIRRWLLSHRASGSFPKAAYCGGGVQSSLITFASHVLGQPMAIYIDSWSGYQKLIHNEEKLAAPAPSELDCS